MKATVIKFYDEQGNEIKNVSTEILVNGETYVKKEADKQPDYSHLVGMWVKFIGLSNSFTQYKWYQCVKNPQLPLAFTDDKGNPNGFYASDIDNTKRFDLTNPKPYNPDTVVGLKELPNDGKCYAECIKDVYCFEKLAFFKGLYYPIILSCGDGMVKENESKESHSLTKQFLDNYFIIHTPAKQVSAIDWLVKQLNKEGFAQVVTQEEIDQAKEIEKKQILDAYCQDNNAQCLTCEQDSEAYYFKTYKTNE